MNKYKAKRIDTFPSKLEKAVYDILLLRQRQGKIKKIKRQPVVKLCAGIKWRIDFECEDENGIFYVEAKGVETGTYKLKKKLYKEFVPNKLEIWKGPYTKPYLSEVING